MMRSMTRFRWLSTVSTRSPWRGGVPSSNKLPTFMSPSSSAVCGAGPEAAEDVWDLSQQHGFSAVFRAAREEPEDGDGEDVERHAERDVDEQRGKGFGRWNGNGGSSGAEPSDAC